MTEKKVTKKKMYEPIKEEFMVLIEYMNILEAKINEDRREEIILLLEVLEFIKAKCEVYLNYHLMKAGK